MNASKVVLGVLASAAVGALMGVLFAPGKGSKTRKKIAAKSEAYAQGLKDRAVDLKDKASHLVESVTDNFHAAKRETNGMAENAKMKLSDTRQ